MCRVVDALYQEAEQTDDPREAEGLRALAFDLEQTPQSSARNRKAQELAKQFLPHLFLEQGTVQTGWGESVTIPPSTPVVIPDMKERAQASRRGRFGR